MSWSVRVSQETIRSRSHLPEVIQVADTPSPIGLDTHNFVKTHDMRGMSGAERPRRVFSTIRYWVSAVFVKDRKHIRVMDVISQFIIFEKAIVPAFHAMR